MFRIFIYVLPLLLGILVGWAQVGGAKTGGEVLPASGETHAALLRIFGRTQMITYSKIGNDAIYGGDMRLGTHEQVQRRNLSNLEVLLREVDTKVLTNRVLAERIESLKAALQNEIGVKAATENDTRLWPRRRIPYRIEESITDPQLRLSILAAIQHWNINTLVKIEPATGADSETLRFRHPGVTEWYCKADLGFYPGYGSGVFINEECPVGTIIHEIGHAVGLTHEHQRPDRVQFLAVEQWAETDTNYETVATNFRTSYDLCSVMHYSADQVPKNAPNWFRLTEAGNKLHGACRNQLPKECREVGQRCGLSRTDRAGINRLYSGVGP